MRIFVPGVEHYADGQAHIKALIGGGKGAGKSRVSSFFPKPFYAMCEPSEASLLDRRVMATVVNTAKDMDEAVKFVKRELMKAPADRNIQTFVVDTVDAYQGKLIVERLGPGKEAMSGPDGDWGWLEGRLNRLMTELLSLQCNVVVLMHCKEKRQDDKSVVWEPLLKGDIRNQIFNPFDLVGNIEMSWEAVGGNRVQKRTLSFEASPEFPWLGDRFHVMPTEIPVILDADPDRSTYSIMLEAILSRMDEIPAGEQMDVDVPGDPRPDGVGAPTPGGPVAPPPARAAKKAAPKAGKAEGEQELTAEQRRAKVAAKLAGQDQLPVAEPSAEPTAEPTVPPQEQNPTGNTGEAPAAAEGVGADPVAVAGDGGAPTPDNIPVPVAEAVAETTAEPAGAQGSPGVTEAAVAVVQGVIRAEPVSEETADVCGKEAGIVDPSASVTGCGKALEAAELSGAQVRIAKIQYGRLLCGDCFAAAKTNK